MKIALVCPYDLGVPGGVQSQVVAQASSLCDKGHEVCVIAPGVGDVTERDVRVTYVGVGRTTPIRANGSVAPISVDPRVIGRTRRALSAFGPDVVHVHEPFAPLLSLGVGHAFARVATFHRAGGASLYGALAPVLSRWASRYDVTAAVSPSAAALVGRAGVDAVVVVFNGTALPAPMSLGNGRAEEATVCFVGRHEARKGLEVLLVAHEGLDGVHLDIAGSGPTTAELKARFPASPQRRWLGRVSDDERTALYRSGWVSCFPSLSGESFGVVLLEAMAAGTAVVASDIDGYRAAAEGHATLVAPGDPLALRAALSQVLDEVAHHKGRGSAEALGAAQAHAATWSMDALCDRYVELYAVAKNRHENRRSPTGP